MKLANIAAMVDVGLDSLIGAVASDHEGKQYLSLISPLDIRPRSLVLVFEPGDTFHSKVCPPGLEYLFTGAPNLQNNVFKVSRKWFHGKESPCLFCPVIY